MSTERKPGSRGVRSPSNPGMGNKPPRGDNEPGPRDKQKSKGSVSGLVPWDAVQPGFAQPWPVQATPSSSGFLAAYAVPVASVNPREDALIEMRAQVGAMIEEVRSLREVVGDLRDEVEARRR